MTGGKKKHVSFKGIVSIFYLLKNGLDFDFGNFFYYSAHLKGKNDKIKVFFGRNYNTTVNTFSSIRLF